MQKRKDYEAQAEEIVQELTNKLDKLTDKTQTARQDAEIKLKELNTKLAQLKYNKEELTRRFEMLKSAGDDAWDDMVGDFEKFLSEVNTEKLNIYEHMEEWFEDMNEKIRHLESQATTAGADIKQGIYEEISYLKVQREKLGVRLGELRESSSDNWDKMKHHLDNGMSTLKDRLTRLYDKMAK